MSETKGFGVSTTEATLREQAAAIAAADLDEQSLLTKFVAEAKAKRIAELRALAAAEASAGEGTGDADSQGFPKEYVRLRVFKGQAATDEQYVKPSVNGYAWKIRRGEEVIVPTVVVNCLNDAVQELTTQTEGGLVTRPAHRFPFQVLGPATEQEYHAFMDNMKQQSKPQVSHV